MNAPSFSAADLSLGLLVLGLLLAIMRVVRGPTLPDRIVGIEMVATLAVGIVAVYAVATAPVSAHVISRAAYLLDVPLWHGSVRDDLRQARLRLRSPDALGGEG